MGTYLSSYYIRLMPELPDRQITDIDKYEMLFFR